MSASPSVNMNWTKAITGSQATFTVAWAGKKSTIITNTMAAPKERLMSSEAMAETGSTIFGNWTCLISRSCRTTELTASVMLLANHFQGRMAEKRKSAKSGVERWRMTDRRIR